jgi:adenylate cyclase
VPTSGHVVVVAVDDPSVDTVGRWPWPRTVFAQLLDRIAAAQPLAIGVDVMFSEPSAFAETDLRRARPSTVTPEAWEQAQTVLADQDRELEASLRRSGRTVLGFFFDELSAHLVGGNDEPDSAVPYSAYNLVSGIGDGRGPRHAWRAAEIRASLPQFADAAKTMGFFNVTPDEGDGFVRRLPMVIAHGDRWAVPLSLATLQTALGNPMLRLRFADYGVESIQFADTLIPVAEDGRLLINYRGPGKTFPHISALDLLDGRVPVEQLAQKIVIVGVTATAVADFRVTPFSEMFPGVEIHANVVDNILSGDFLHQPRWTVAIDLFSIVAIALVLGIGLQRLRGVAGLVFAAVVLAAYLVGSQMVFLKLGMPLSLVYPILSIVLTFTGVVVLQYVTEEREKRKVRRALALYLSPSMADLVSDQPERLKLGGDKRDMTVFFSDIRSFTSISEKLAPEELVVLLNEYLGAMTDIIFAHDGMLDKYIGDAVMAVWGAPLEQPDHARRASLATLEMVHRLAQLNRGWEARGWPRLEIGCGLNSGPMVFGNMGSEQHLALTVMGDNVNLGSRLEGTNKTYGTNIIASESTVREAGDAIVVRELDLIRVKGREEAVRMYEILGAGDEQPRWEPVIREFESGLAHYRSRRWDDASACFERVLEAKPGDGPARLYLERCARFATDPPPPTWTGVTVMETK